jgi:hypothetical protein
MSRQKFRDDVFEYLSVGHGGLRGGCALLLAGILWIVAGGQGIALAAVVSVVWALIATPYTVAVGQLVYAVWLAEMDIPGIFGIVSFGLLFVPGLFAQWHRETALIAMLVLAMATAVFAGSLFVESVVFAAFGLCLGFAVVAYSIHRYELVRFGLVTADS